MTVSAPGKLVLLGDYAVLEGGPAMIAAVDRRATGRLLRELVPASEVVQAVIDQASDLAFDPRVDSIVIDTDRFHDEQGNKLGIGSSAAVAVCAAALATGRRDESCFELAVVAHRAAAGGRGSGIDVAASYYGGVIATRRQPAPVQPLPSKLPGLFLGVLFTGESAKTETMIQACRASSKWSMHAKHLGQLAEEGLQAWSKQDAARFLSVTARYGRAMGALGRDAEVEIVTEKIEAIMRLAGEADAAAKPSGAGGGDIAIVWARDPETVSRVAERSETTWVEMAIDAQGLRQERS